MPQSLRIQMLAFPNCQILDVVGPLQMFAGVNDELDWEAYELRIAAPARGLFKTNSGMCLNADLAYADVAAEHFCCTDTVIAAGGDDGVRTQLANGELTALIRSAARDGARIVSVCTGAFFLAAAGILDGRRAATHWEGVERLRRFRPQVEVDAESIYVRDGNVWTSAGVTAGIDLALALIEADHGRDVALAVARRHVVFPIRPGGQSQFSPGLAVHGVRDRRLGRLAERVTQSPADDWCIGALAAEAGVSLRSLTRLFRRELGASPAEFVERVRVDEARRALLETNEPIETIALTRGFGSLRRMDRAFARTIAATPTEFRDRFKPAQSPSTGATRCPSSPLAS